MHDTQKLFSGDDFSEISQLYFSVLTNFDEMKRFLELLGYKELVSMNLFSRSCSYKNNITSATISHDIFEFWSLSNNLEYPDEVDRSCLHISYLYR